MKKLTTSQLVAKKPTIEQFKKQKRNPIYIILNNIRSLQNVGLIFRLSDALLVEKLYLCGTTGYPPVENDERRPGVVEHAQHEIEKTAIRTVDYVPWEYQENTVEVIKKLKKEGVQIIALEQTDKSKDFRKIDYKFPLVLVLGHEREGIEDEVLKLADEVAEIPILGMGNSLNVATTLAIIGYHLLEKLI
jgi:tRNA G18 (ribose-2'-O)-methylase SpoU